MSTLRDQETARRHYNAENAILSAPLPTSLALADVANERARQEQLMARGKFSFTCASALTTDEMKLPVLGEEFGEVCRELNERKPGWRKRLRTELIQLAACSVAWAEALKDEVAS